MANDDLILDALEYINPADLGYKTWINIGYALKNENFPLEVWDSWSRTDKRHKDRDCSKRWNGLNNRNVHGGYIVKIAKGNGFNPKQNHYKPRPEKKKGQTKFACTFDSFEYKEKPSGSEFGKITNRMKNAGPETVTVKQFASYMESGRTCLPSINKWKVDSDSVAHAHSIAQQIFIQDVDNEKVVNGETVPIDNPITIEQAKAIYKKHGIKPSIIYETFNSKKHRNDKEKPYKKFRMVVVLDRPVLAEEYGEIGIKEIREYFSGLLCDASDNTDDAARKFLGTDEPMVLVEDVSNKLDDVRKKAAMAKAEPERITSIYNEIVGANAKAEINLEQFHSYKGQWHVIHFKVAEYIKKNMDIIFLGGVQPFVYDNGVFWIDPNGLRTKKEIRSLMFPECIKAATIDAIYKLLENDVDLFTTYEKLNNQPKTWINFKNGFFDCLDNKWHKHDPKYKCINQIPHVYDPDAKPKGERIEKYLQQSFPDDADRQMYLEFSGYSMTTDTTQQVLMIIKGKEGSGKSVAMSLNSAVIGTENISAIPLEDLSERFVSFGLVGKQMNLCGDLQTKTINDVSMVKKITGEDLIEVEKKKKDRFQYRCYAKMLFNTNDLPYIESERTNALYRRLLIVPMENVPKEPDVNIKQKLGEEIDYFIHLIVAAAGEMYKRGKIFRSDNSIHLVEEMRAKSDSVQAWMMECCIIDEQARTQRGDAFSSYEKYCAMMERKAHTKRNFYDSLKAKGFPEIKRSDYYFKGFKIMNEGFTLLSDDENIEF